MNTESVLIVDDEKNIRLTLAQALEPVGLNIQTAVNGEEALQKIAAQTFHLVLLDLKMPGINGIEVLRELYKARPEIKVIIITAHGTVDNAVEAMKLGAVDFIQKPFPPKEIRELVNRVLARAHLEISGINGFTGHLEWARRCVHEKHFSSAEEHVRKAIALDASRAEGFNFLGALLEIRGDVQAARKNYRAAYALDPTYRPARDNLDRISTLPRTSGRILLDGHEPF